jgi:NMT1-like family
MKLLLLYRRRWWLFYLPVLLCTAAALWWSVKVWKVLPPTQLLIAAGAPQGSYSRLAQRYAEQLERDGLNVEIVYADTQRGSLDRLAETTDAAVIGFAQGIYADDASQVQALAVVGQEPVWVFSGPTGPASLVQARGKRLAVGPPLSSSYMAARDLLAHAGLKTTDVQLDSLTGLPAANALLDGKVDMVFETGGEDAQAVQLLALNGTVQLLGTERAGALAAHQPRLQPILLPQGAIELRGDVPARDLTLMSLQTHLLVRPEMHPALQRVVLEAALNIHQFPSFLQRQGQFPSFRGSDFPLTPTARQFGLGDRPWLESLLPYQKAQWAELVLYAVLPILAVAVLLLTWIPRLFDWRISAALHSFYGELKFIETEMDSVAVDNPMTLRRLLERLDAIEKKVIALDLPDAFSGRWYTLREHLAAAREKMLKLRAR